MFDMATVLIGSSPHGKMSSSSPSGGHSSPNGGGGAHTPSHQLIPPHHQSHFHIKREPGLLSPPSGSENDLPQPHPSSAAHMNHNICSKENSPSGGGGGGSGAELFSAKCKRKINFSHLGIPPRGHQPATVARRNARERNRVKQVSEGLSPHS